MANSAGTPATALLRRAGVTHTLHPYEHDPRAVGYGDEAAAALGVDPSRVFKTLIARVDVAASRFDTVFVSAGRRGLQVELAPTDLIRLTEAGEAAVTT